MTEPPSIKLRPRRRRWFVRIALGVAFFLVASVVGLWWRGQREAALGRLELDEAVAETDQLDPRWRWEQIHADLPPLPEAEDSMRVIHAAAKANGGWKPKDLWLANDEDLLDDHLPTNRRFSGERLTLLRETLKKRQPAVALSVSLKGYPRGRGDYQIQPNVLSTLLDHVVHCRDVAPLLVMESEGRLHDGKPDEAAEQITALLHVGAALREDPFLISLLGRVALRRNATDRVQRLLGMGLVPDDCCRQLMKHLASERDENLLRTALRGERAGYHLLFENLETGRLPLAEFMAELGEYKNGPDLEMRLSSLIYARRLYEDHAHLLRRYNEFLEVAALPPWEQLGQWEALDLEFRSLRAEMLKQRRMIFSLLLLPAVRKVAEATLRDQAMLSSAIAALAAERFRLANNRWPKALGELCPTYLPVVPLDPYNGEPLTYAVKEDAAVVYSVGPDGIDGGGAELRPPKGNAIGPHDLGIRLWNPDQRGLPPEKPKDADGHR